VTIDDALQFLRDHQPLPPTDSLSDDILRQFDEVRKFFISNPDARCVSLLLNSFGKGDGHGVYQLVEDTILAFPDEVVVPALEGSLRNPAGSVRYWSAQIAANYPRQELAEPLMDLLKHGNLDERIAAVTALELLGTPQAHSEMESALSADIEDEVKEMIHQALSTIRGQAPMALP
jgi:HEAT repeat protein